MNSIECIMDLALASSLMVVLVSPFLRPRRAWMLAVAEAMLLTLLSALLVAWGGEGTAIYDGNLVVDRYMAGFALIVSLTSVLALYAAGPVVCNWSTGSAFYSLSILALFGTYSMLFTANLFVAMTAWILVSVASYAAAALPKDEDSAEGAVKYALMGSASSTLLLLAGALYFVFAGGAEIHRAPEVSEFFGRIAALALVVLLISAAGFKMGVFPFHTWLPDTYGGVHPSVVAFLIDMSKLISIAAIYRLGLPLAERYPEYWFSVLSAFSVFTMTYGNLGALSTDNVQRLMAYSSIANAGYFLVGLSALAPLPGMKREWALMGMLIYYAAYAFGKTGGFTALAEVKESKGSVLFDDIRGLSFSAPTTAAGFSVLLLSLMGMPPLLGFWGKVYMFASVAYYAPWLALIAAINTVFSVAYYAKLIKSMYFERGGNRIRETTPQKLVVAATAVLSLVLALGLIQWMASLLV